MENLNKTIDHTLLKPDALSSDIIKLCKEAKTHHFATVCIHPSHVKKAVEILTDTDVGVCTVVGFPLGATLSSVKAFETRMAVDRGAKEIDMVINIGALKEKNYTLVEKDIAAVVEAASGRLVKVILETCLLSEEEIIKACRCAMEAKAQFVKTSTGFSTSGASLEAVKLMKKTVGDSLGVKASGGIKNADQAKSFLEAGASRIGTSSSLAIIGLDEKSKDY